MSSISNDFFNIHDFPAAYFGDNEKANVLRSQIIKNQVRIPECEQGLLETIFFSDENIDLINKQLIMTVFKKTNGEYKISPQSKTSLEIVMRYVFIEHARHLPFNIVGQIRELNCRVVGEITPKIITEVTQRVEYLNTINNPRQILDLPKNVNNSKNDKSLPSVTTVLFN